MNLLKLRSAVIKHNGMTADKGTKVTLYLPEMTDEEVTNLYKLVQNVTVDLIITDPDTLEEL